MTVPVDDPPRPTLSYSEAAAARPLPRHEPLKTRIMSACPPPTIEDARATDLTAVLAILNHYIATDHCTFDTEPWSVKQKQAWFDAFQADNPYRLLVARAGSQLLGYAHSGAWRPKKAYQVTAETTVYLHPDAAGQGLGARLLRELLATLAAAGVERAVAGVAQPNPASDRLHAALGFARVGTFERVGHKFGRHWDVTWWQRDTRA